MKILYVIDSLGTGGAERSTADLWYYLRQQEIAVEIVVLRHRNEGVEKEILDNDFLVHFLKGATFFSQSREIAKLISSTHPDIVHSVLFKSNLRTRLAKVFTKFIHVESLVNCTYDPVRFSDPRVNRWVLRFYRFLDRITHRFTDHFIAITEVVKQHYHEVLRIPHGKMSVIYRGRSNNEFLGEREVLRRRYCREFNIPDDAVIVIQVGRQEYQKGHLILLKALKNINPGRQAVFFFLGREGSSSPDIKTFLESNSLPFQMHWLGHRNDVGQFLAAADIFVFPSLYEGLGGALIEAQAAALPIVCSDIPVLNEVVIRNETALMFERGNEVALASSLTRLIDNKELRLAMGEKSKSNFNRRFNLAGVNSAMVASYQSLLK